MTSKGLLSFSLFFLLAPSLLGCSTPIGPINHNPKELFLLQPDLTSSSQTGRQAVPEDAPLIVLAQFQDLSSAPSGGYYDFRRQEITPLYLTFSSRTLSGALFEYVYESLRSRGVNVVKCYDPGIVSLPPGGETKRYLVKVRIIVLEVDTILTGSEHHDAARVKIKAFIYSENGEKLTSIRVKALARERRSQDSDVLKILAERLASGIINEGKPYL